MEAEHEQKKEVEMDESSEDLFPDPPASETEQEAKQETKEKSTDCKAKQITPSVKEGKAASTQTDAEQEQKKGMEPDETSEDLFPDPPTSEEEPLTNSPNIKGDQQETSTTKKKVE